MFLIIYNIFWLRSVDENCIDIWTGCQAENQPPWYSVNLTERATGFVSLGVCQARRPWLWQEYCPIKAHIIIIISVEGATIRAFKLYNLIVCFFQLNLSENFLRLLCFPFPHDKHYFSPAGAFLIPYVLCVVFGSLPLFYLEVAVGQFMNRGGLQCWNLVPILQGNVLLSSYAGNW